LVTVSKKVVGDPLYGRVLSEESQTVELRLSSFGIIFK